MLRSLLFHFRKNGVCHHVTGQKLVDKSLPLGVEKDCALASDRLGNEELSATFFLGIESCGMDLNVINMLQLDAVFEGKRDGVTRQVLIVGRMLEDTADAACGKYGIVRPNSGINAVFVVTDDTAALVTFTNEVNHRVVFDDGDILPRSCGFKQVRGDLLAGLVLVEQNTLMGVRPLTRVNKRLPVLLKANAKGYEIRNDLLRGMDHDMYRIGIVLVMSRLHRILVEGVVIVLVTQHADAALRKIRVASASLILGYYYYTLFFRQIQGAI